MIVRAAGNNISRALPTARPVPAETTGHTSPPDAPATVTSTLSEEELQLIEQLKLRDAEVRAHEAAHQAAGGATVGAASFTYQIGPDHRAYAVGGEVPVSLHTGGSPEETIANARRVRAAALAPAEPSSQDFAVAAAASSLESSAQLQQQQLEQAQTLERRPTHIHFGEPCFACARDNQKYVALAKGGPVMSHRF